MADERDLVGLDEVDRTDVALVGGKAAHLGELRRIDGVRVPDGVCVTTAAFRRVVAADPAVAAAVEALAGLAPEADAERAVRSAAARAAVEAVAVPEDLAAALGAAVARLAGDASAGEDVALAVRSSATAEDTPTASAAGQQDSYLDVAGADVVAHVRRCWASLFTDRAVAYRARAGVGPQEARMAVVVQRMVPARAAGVLFTADPVTGRRTVATVEAVPGRGDALVAGRATPDAYRVHADAVVDRTLAPGRSAPVLADDDVLALVRLGRRIEAHMGSPQDVEWCRADDGLHVVQSRPITTLFPVPETDDDAGHVYVSVGHQQMMTDAMRPLGLSLWQMTTPRPMCEAGGRLFVDVTQILAAPASRSALLDVFGRSDPLVVDALRTVLDRGDLVPSGPDDPDAVPPLPSLPDTLLDPDPEIVTGLIADNAASVAALRDRLAAASGPEVLDLVVDDLPELRDQLHARSHDVVMAGMQAAWWLEDHVEEWLGETGTVAVLSQAVPHNVTSEMGLALLDVADEVRPHPEVVAFLEGVSGARGADVLDGLEAVPGGAGALAAIRAYLDRYGMRGVGEIDVTRPRWDEQPAALVPVILGHVAAFAPGEAGRRLARGRAEAEAAAAGLVERLRAQPDGAARAAETEAAIARLRAFTGFREYPKYGMVSRYHLYRRAILAEADRLVDEGVVADREDVFLLRFDELREVVRTRSADRGLIAARRRDLRASEALTPPRVLTSEGEALQGSFHRTDLPPGALAGLGVSAGVVEGRARVVTDMGEADVAPGDVLVTAFTDPSWSPLFVTVAGLVTEVGGMMTHGAVVAREYGLPAVVGVDGATRRIPDGARIRVDGTTGTVEVQRGAAG